MTHSVPFRARPWRNARTKARIIVAHAYVASLKHALLGGGARVCEFQGVLVFRCNLERGAVVRVCDLNLNGHLVGYRSSFLSYRWVGHLFNAGRRRVALAYIATGTLLDYNLQDLEVVLQVSQPIPPNHRLDGVAERVHAIDLHEWAPPFEADAPSLGRH